MLCLFNNTQLSGTLTDPFVTAKMTGHDWLSALFQPSSPIHRITPAMKRMKTIKMPTLCILAFLSFSGWAQQQMPKTGAKDVMLMNRIGPSTSDLYLANADGTDEHKLFVHSGFDYHASFSGDGRWVVFTSERNGFGQADIYRARVDGTGLEQLTDNPALDDQAALSPDAGQVAFVSTRENHTANVWLYNLRTKKSHNLTA